MTDWISTGIVAVVVIVGLALFYKVLQEPFDLLFAFLKKGFSAIFGKIGEYGSGSTETVGKVITYD